MPYLDVDSNVFCQFLSITVKPSTNAIDSASWMSINSDPAVNNTFQVYHNEFTTPLTNPTTTLNTWDFTDINVPFAGVTWVGTAESFGITTLNGIWRVDGVISPDNINNAEELDNPTVGIAITCDIDVCIAEKMRVYLDKNSSCGCDSGSKCRDKDLEVIYKIYMLGEAAKTHARELAFDNAYTLYQEALRLCAATTTGSCNCNCG